MSSKEVIPEDVLIVEDEAGETRVPGYDSRLDCFAGSLRLKEDIFESIWACLRGSRLRVKGEPAFQGA